jgi:reactive intermediate/imine deaminase
MRRIETDQAPSPAGHYSQAIAHGDMLWISGQLPVRADGTRCDGEPFEVQARQAMTNLLAILGAGGGRPEDLVKVTAYIKGVEHWPTFNSIYAEMMGDARPARAIVPVPELHYGLLVELEGCAVTS